MMGGSKRWVTLICIGFIFPCYSQSSSRLFSDADTAVQKIQWRKVFKPQKSFISSYLLPAMCIGYGLTGLESDGIQNVNFEVKEEVFIEHAHGLHHIDNYLQFSPAAAVYALNALGIKGKHNMADRSKVYILSNLILTGTCLLTKKITYVLRPDGSAYSSFPSGHTAEAFASAEFLRQEYREVSPWYGIAGYAAAAATGYLRLYNNKHWLSDVVAGAGVGILSTKISYLLYPEIQKVLFKKKRSSSFVLPSYNNGSFGIAVVKLF